MSMTAMGRSGAFVAQPRGVARPPASSRRLAWISVVLGLISLDLEALAVLAPLLVAYVAPLRWYADLALRYGPATTATVAMCALGAPLAVAGMLCAGATVRRGRVPFATLLGVAICAVSLAAPVCYAIFVLTFLRGLL